MGYSGPFFEDFEVGQLVRHRPCRTLYQWDNVFWSALTLDYSPLFLDEWYASYTRFGRPVVNPRLVMSVVIGVATRDTSINSLAFLGFDYERLHGVVYPGDTLCVESEVVGVRGSKSRPNVGVVSWVHRAYNQRGELVYEVRRSNLVYRRGGSPWSGLVGGGRPTVSPQQQGVRGGTPQVSAEWSPPHGRWMGRFLEDFVVGETIVHRLGRTVGQADNVFSSALSLNTASLHFDAEYMLFHEHGRPLVQGPFVVGVGCGLGSLDLSANVAAELGLGELRLVAPVFEGDTLHAKSEVLAVEPSLGGETGTVTLRTTVYKDMFRTAVASFTRRIEVYSSKASPWVKIWGS